MSEIKQKITWDDYKRELQLMSIKTKEVKKRLVNEAKNASKWGTIIGYPAKVLLTLTATGGGIQIFSENQDDQWITILRTVIEVIVLILVSTKDSFNFEKKKEKYLLAAKAMDTFHELVRFQTFQVRGMEGDRYEALKDLKEMYGEIVQNNQVIQMVESLSGDITPNQMESQLDSDEEYSSASSSLETAQNSPKNRRRSSVPKMLSQKTNERNRMFYLHKMIDDIN